MYTWLNDMALLLDKSPLIFISLQWLVILCAFFMDNRDELLKWLKTLLVGSKETVYRSLNWITGHPFPPLVLILIMERNNVRHVIGCLVKLENGCLWRPGLESFYFLELSKHRWCLIYPAEPSSLQLNSAATQNLYNSKATFFTLT